MERLRLLRCKDCGTYHVTWGFIPKCTSCGCTGLMKARPAQVRKAESKGRVVTHHYTRREFRGKPRREPMRVFHVLASKSGLSFEEQTATNRLFDNGELSDLPVRNLLRTLGCA